MRVAAALYQGRIGRLTLAVALCCALGAAAWAQAASAYTTAGARWPGRTAKITYWNGTGYTSELAAAVRAWNTSGARVRFVKARRSRARVRITLTDPVNDGGFGASGVASLGFGRGTFVRVSRGSSGASLTGVLAHELGHVLGLGHEDGTCATMNSVPWSLCGNQKPCSILEPDDIRGVIHRYGGRLKKGRAELCPPAVASPTIDLIPGSYRAQARFRMPSALSVAGYAVAVGIGSCPDTSPAELQSTTARAGQEVTVDITPFQDPHGAAGKLLCTKIWTLGESGRVSARPATLEIIYRPDPVGPPTGLTLQHTPDGVIASWTPSAHQQIRSYDLAWLPGDTCPADPDNVPMIQRASVVHPTTTLRIALAPGSYCMAVFSRDRFDVVSASGTSATFTVG